jgi:predicted ATP-dependent protease
MRGLSGDQGVIIPASNVPHLMLRRDVREAVEQGRFSVHAIETVDDGIEVLTGLPAGRRDEDGHYPDGSINRLVEDRLATFSERMRAHAGKTGDDWATGGSSPAEGPLP